MIPGTMTVDVHPDVTADPLPGRGRKPHWHLNFCSAMNTFCDAPRQIGEVRFIFGHNRPNIPFRTQETRT